MISCQTCNYKMEQMWNDGFCWCPRCGTVRIKETLESEFVSNWQPRIVFAAQDMVKVTDRISWLQRFRANLVKCCSPDNPPLDTEEKTRTINE